MEKINLTQQSHVVKQGDVCGAMPPNVIKDSLFILDGKPIGFYLRKVPDLLRKYLEIANAEFLSQRVPKSSMDRVGKVVQYSTILGSIPPKSLVRRNYKTKSSVHSVASANTFVKAMLLACEESEKLIKEFLPTQYEQQREIFKEVQDEWKFGNLFTSSISNFNISAQYHRDNGNLRDTVNVILTKRLNSTGGCLNVPDYGATIDQADNSLLVYPAWKNIHGVTPIVPIFEGGYRNSFIFYPLKAFNKEKEI